MSSLLIKLLHQDAIMPCRQSKMAAGYDICCIEDVTLMPFERKLVSTGVSMTVPENTYGQLAPRSGLSVKHGIHVMAGVIDRDYTGEVKVLLYNTSSTTEVSIKSKERIAQLILKRIETPEVIEVDELETTLRGTGGFGSTG